MSTTTTTTSVRKHLPNTAVTWNRVEDEFLILIQQTAARLAQEHGVEALRYTDKLGLCWYMGRKNGMKIYYSECRLLADFRAVQANQKYAEAV